MSILNQINLIMFTTTVGHCGFKDIYKYTLNHTKKFLDFSQFGGKLAALKVHNNDEDTFIDMCNDFRGFNIIKEYGRVKIEENPHKTEADYAPYMVNSYSVSVSNAFSFLPIDTEYCLWLEGDRVMYFKDNDYEHYLKEGIELLKNNPDIFAVYINGPEHNFTSPGLFEETSYSYRPHLLRSNQMYNVAQCFKANYEKIKYIHPELIYEQIIKSLYQNAKFAYFDPKQAWHVHLGESIFLEKKEKLGLTLD